MHIKQIHVENFRSIHNATLECNQLTILVGTNGAGKSTLIKALDMFFAKSPKFEAADFHNGDISKNIVIAVTFTDLSNHALERFKKYVQEGDLTAEMVITWDDERATITIHGSKFQNPDFYDIREAKLKREAIKQYSDLRSQESYIELPVLRKYDDILETFEGWEEEHPEKCQMMRDSGQFYGFVQQGYLRDYIQFLFIEAVRDATTDAVERKGSAITRLMDHVVRSTLEQDDEFILFKNETQERYRQIVDPEKMEELNILENTLTQTIQRFVPDAEVGLSWQPLSTLSIPLPNANVSLVEDQYKTSVDRAGHGLQRAFILTLLQHLSFIDSEPSNTEQAGFPTLIIAIEEPELYQHPSRQRHFEKVLRELADDPQYQIFHATHSPLLISVEHFSNVRLVKKIVSIESEIGASYVLHSDLEAVVDILRRAKDSVDYSEADLVTKLPQLMTPYVNEGFFANVVVVVEGEGDRAALLETASQMGHDFESLGVAIIPCSGKGNLLIPSSIFRQLEVPVFLMWDNDRPGESNELLRFVDRKSKKVLENIVEPTYTCFKTTREDCVMLEIGRNRYTRILNEIKTELGSKNEKSPLVVRLLIQKATNEGFPSQTLCSTVTNILAMKL